MSDQLPGPIHRQMTIEEYHDFPRHLGWKYEYYGGKIHVTRREVMVPLILDLPRGRRGGRSEKAARQGSGEPVAGLTLRPVEAEDERRLFDLFIAAFSSTIDFAGYPQERFLEEARKCLRRHFGEQRGRRLPASRVAEHGEQPVGAFLLREFERGVLLDMAFVDPARQGSGIGTHLLEAAVRELVRGGETRLYSCCFLGNESSLAWHQRRGFREQPHLQVLALRARHYREELKRRQRLGCADERELRRLAEIADELQELYRQLEAAVGNDYMAGCPLYH